MQVLLQKFPGRYVPGNLLPMIYKILLNDDFSSFSINNFNIDTIRGFSYFCPIHIVVGCIAVNGIYTFNRTAACVHIYNESE